MLTLPIKKKWFDMILSGEKKEEYRDMTPYYTTRFEKIFLDVENEEVKNNFVIFRNGYRKDSPKIKCLCSFEVDYGKSKWGGNPHELCYVLKILSVEEIE